MDNANTNRHGIGAFEAIAIIVAVILGTVTALSWLPAELAARIQHGRWPSLGLVDLRDIGWYWATHPTDPIGGWPAADRADRPSGAVYLVVASLELLVLVVVGVAAFHLAGRLLQGGTIRLSGGARHEAPIPKEHRV